MICISGVTDKEKLLQASSILISSDTHGDDARRALVRNAKIVLQRTYLTSMISSNDRVSKVPLVGQTDMRSTAQEGPHHNTPYLGRSTIDSVDGPTNFRIDPVVQPRLSVKVTLLE